MSEREKIGALQAVAGWIMKPSKSRLQLACISCQPRITSTMKKPRDSDLLMIFFSFLQQQVTIKSPVAAAEKADFFNPISFFHQF